MTLEGNKSTDEGLKFSAPHQFGWGWGRVGCILTLNFVCYIGWASASGIYHPHTPHPPAKEKKVRYISHTSAPTPPPSLKHVLYTIGNTQTNICRYKHNTPSPTTTKKKKKKKKKKRKILLHSFYLSVVFI